MKRNDNDDSRSVAVYWDFEKLHAGITTTKYGESASAKQHNRFKPQEPLVHVQALVDLSASPLHTALQLCVHGSHIQTKIEC